MSEGEAGPLPLSGIRVLDFTQALAGPYGTMVLADLGAEVIKLEVPGRGDDTRHWGPPFIGGESAYFLSINRNKKSVALNLKSEGGLRAALDLAARSDVVVENFRPGTMAKLGLGPDELRGRDPRLVYCSISGFGQEGEPRAGYDQIVQGTAGLMSITGFPDGPPVKVGVPISDIVAGMFGAHAVVACLYERERTEEGRYVDVAMQDSVIALLTFQAGRYFATGKAPTRQGNQHPTISPYGTFETADGYLNVSVGNDAQWRRFCDALGSADLAADERFSTNSKRLTERPALDPILEPLLKRRTTKEWLARLEAAAVPSGPIRTLDEVFNDEQVLARGLKSDLEHPAAGLISVVGPPWRMDGAGTEARMPPPLIGQHTAEVLIAVAGYTRAEVEALAMGGDIEVVHPETGAET
ncbi:MAG: CoA transferase [Actinobacteria bacterium]|nr:CoA transferase [Actinomycetota bacterium]